MHCFYHMQNERPHGLDEKARLRWQDESCANCRYFRLHKTVAITSNCLLLGHTLGIHTDDGEALGWLVCAARERVCDAWKRRPKTWETYSKGTDASPYWVDPYIPRETQIRLAKRLAKAK